MLWACGLLCKKAWRGRGRAEIKGKRRRKSFRAGEQFECLEVGERFEGLVGGDGWGGGVGDNFP